MMLPNQTSWAFMFVLVLPIASAISEHEECQAEAPSEEDEACLFQAETHMQKFSAEALSEADEHRHIEKQFPAKFFGDFSEGESTYSYDGSLAGHKSDPMLNVLTGWTPQQKDSDPLDQLLDRQDRPGEWFTESPSGGHHAAFQLYPSMSSDNAVANRAETGHFWSDNGGTLRQEYQSGSTVGRGTDLLSDRQSQEIPASWFDSYVNQLDGFGRSQMPAPESPRNYLDWEERTANTTLECKDPGCTASANLKAPFDFDKEVYKNCRLSVFFRPTDFDDQYSGEMVEWVRLNDKTVGSNCRPVGSGGNQTAQRPLLPCVKDLSIDHLISEKKGSLELSAKIPKVVDESPYNGNMLSSVPMVTCLVAQKNNITAKPQPILTQEQSCFTKMPLQCATRGCAAEISITIAPHCVKLDQCTLSVNVSQTDFDNGDGTEELIEYIKVANATVKSAVNPGENPCKTAWKGGTKDPLLVQRSAYTYSVVADQPVQFDKHRRLVVEGKISQYVDECASNGYLLDAMASVTCKNAVQYTQSDTPRAPESALLQTQKKAAVPRTHRKQLRGNAL